MVQNPQIPDLHLKRQSQRLSRNSKDKRTQKEGTKEGRRSGLVSHADRIPARTPSRPCQVFLSSILLPPFIVQPIPVPAACDESIEPIQSIPIQ